MKIQRRQFLALSTRGFGLFGAIAERLWGQTLPSPIRLPQEPKLHFVSLSDTGTGEDGQKAVANAAIRYYKQCIFKFKLVLLAGDNIYKNGEIEKIHRVFEEPYAFLLEKNVEFRACLGNHDIKTNNGNSQIEYPQFNMKGRYYTFRHKPVQFFALDTSAALETSDDRKGSAWHKQLKWLEKELRKTNRKNKVTWKIVFGHHPVFSSASYGVEEKLVKDLVPLFKEYGVHLYICGHDHVYERTLSIEGTTYLICGASARSRPAGCSSRTARSAEGLSFVAYEVYHDRIIIRGFDINNRIFDEGFIKL